MDKFTLKFLDEKVEEAFNAQRTLNDILYLKSLNLLYIICLIIYAFMPSNISLGGYIYLMICLFYEIGVVHYNYN
jgi:hypothetical protein